MTNPYLIVMGAPTWPPNPPPSERPGTPVALLCFLGGPDMAPKPPTLGAPRDTRGAPLFSWGPPHGPPTPPPPGPPGPPGRPPPFFWRPPSPPPPPPPRAPRAPRHPPR